MKYYAYAVVAKDALIQRATLETEGAARDFIKCYGDDSHRIVTLTGGADRPIGQMEWEGFQATIERKNAALEGRG